MNQLHDHGSLADGGGASFRRVVGGGNSAGPRMLRLTGRLGDGWLPSLGGPYIQPEDATPMHAAIDEAAKRAGRDPAEIERAVNVMALGGPPRTWVDQVASIAVDLRFSTLILGLPEEDPVSFIWRLGEDVAPRLRETLD